MKRFLSIVMLALLSTSCATLFSKGSDSITITSEPPGASVYLDARKRGVTPLTLNVKRSVLNSSYVQLKKKGYKTKKFMLKKSLTTAAIFNLSSVLSWATDVTSGNMIQYSPNDYLIELEKNEGKTTSIFEDMSLKFVLVNKNLILKEIASGEGEYLKTALKSFKVPESKVNTSIAKLQKELPGLSSESNEYEFYKEMKRILNS